MPESPALVSPLSSDAAAQRIVVLLCTYNEAANLSKLLDLLSLHLPIADILVVDDSSPDGTSNMVRQHARYAEFESVPPRPAIYLMQRSSKRGLGSATRTGLAWCVERKYDFAINLDADLSHDPVDAPKLLAACLDNVPPADVAIGSRYVPGGGFGGLAWHRRTISRLLNGYATRLLRLPIKDCSGSYRCYRVKSLDSIDLSRLTCPGYGFLEELLVALHRQGARLTEVPIQFSSRSNGRSKLGLRDALGVFGVIHRLAFRR